MPAAALAALAELSTLQDRLDGVLDMGQLFRAPVAESLELVRTCKAIAGGWQANYLTMRERLEASGHPARWEFSRQLLFEKTNYAAEVRRLAVGTTAGDCVCDLPSHGCNCSAACSAAQPTALPTSPPAVS